MDTTAEQTDRPPFRPLPPAVFALIDVPLAVLAAAALSPAIGRRLSLRLRWLTPRVARALLVASVVAHLGEAVVAWHQARDAGLDAPRWAAQTALAGVPSLLVLRGQAGSNRA
jgi:hypothetical protein